MSELIENACFGRFQAGHASLYTSIPTPDYQRLFESVSGGGDRVGD